MAAPDASSTTAPLEPGQHICCLYETRQERRVSLTSFVQEGIERGEKVLLILDDSVDDAALNDLLTAGSQLESFLNSEQLTLLAAEDTYVQDDVFDPDRVIGMLEAETERAIADGYGGLRVAGSTTWLQRQAKSEQLIEYENKLNAFSPDSRCLVLCQYDRRCSDPELLLKVLAIHPTVVVGTERYDHFCCLPPTEFVQGDVSEAVLRFWLEILTARKRTTEALRVSDSQLRAQYKSLPIPTSTWQRSDGDFVLIDYNDATANLTDGRIKDLVGRRASDLYSDMPDILADFQRCYEDGTAIIREMTYTFRSTGETRILDFTAVFVPPDLAMVHAEDITERKQTQAALQRQAQVIDQIHDSVISTDLDGYVTSWNKGAERLFGYTAQEALGRHISFVYPVEQHEFLEREVIRPLREKGDHELSVVMRRRSGEDFHAHLSLSLLRDGQDAAIGMIGYAIDITDEVKAKTTLEAHARQQAALAKLGQRALADIDLSTLMDEATSVVAETLEVDYCKVLELLPDGEALLLRAGVGWQDGSVGYTKVNAKTRSQAGYTLLSGEPVIVDDLRTETRFKGPQLLIDHAVVSGVSVIIRGQDRPFGILGAHTTQRRTFTDDSVHFLQAVANVLAEAIERKRAEQAILQQADLLEQTHDAIIVWESGGKILSWNKGAEDLYGWSREEAVGQVTHELLKSQHPVSIQELEAALEQQGHWEGEVTHTARDGRQVTVESRHVLARYASGSQFVLETNHDITERKRTEERLAYQAHLLANVHDAIVAVDDKFTITAWNYAAERLYGWPADEVLGRKAQEVIPSEITAAQRAEALLTLRETGHYRAEVVQYRRDGESIHVEGTTIALRDDNGRATGYVSVNRDITQRKRAYAALMESEMRFRQLAENIREVFWIATSDGEHVLYASPAYEEVWGRSVESLQADPSTWQEAIHPDDRETVRSAYTPDRLARGPFNEEYRVLRPDGSIRWIWDRGFPIRDEQGDVYRIVGIAEDITERKHAAQALQHHAQRLEILHQIDRAVLGAHSLEEIAQVALRHMQELVPCSRASVVVFDEVARSGVVLTANVLGETRLGVGARVPLEMFGDMEQFRQGKVHAVDDIQAISPRPSSVQALHEEGIRSYVNLPLIAQGELIGSLSLGSDQPRTFAPADVEIAREVADLMAIAILQARLFEQLSAAHHRLQVLSHRLVEAQETERQRIARELHDEIGQTFTAVKINLQALQRLQEVGGLASRLDTSIDLVEHAVQQVRDLLLELRPPLLDDLGLVATLRWYADRQAQLGRFSTEVVTEPRAIHVRPELETTCFRIVQEALTNVLRYAKANHVRIGLYQRDADLEMIIRDDGVGFDVPGALNAATRGASLGLLGMQERARLAGGHVVIDSQPGHGTEIRACFPIREA